MARAITSGGQRRSRLAGLGIWIDKSTLLDDAKHLRVLGIDVYAVAEDPGMATLQLAKVERALHLIARLDPRRLASIKRNVKRIAVRSHEGTHWNSALRMIVLRWEWTYKQHAERNALDLVHEATHARLDRWGIRQEGDLLPRVEALCLKEEIRFSRHLADEYKLTTDRLKALENPWWTPTKHIERSVADLRALGAPRWSIWILERLFRWRHRKGIK